MQYCMFSYIFMIIEGRNDVNHYILQLLNLHKEVVSPIDAQYTYSHIWRKFLCLLSLKLLRGQTFQTITAIRTTEVDKVPRHKNFLQMRLYICTVH